MDQQKEQKQQQINQDLQKSKQNPKQNTILDLGPIPLPEGTAISKNNYGYCYIATRPFKKGQIVYKCGYVEAPVNTDKFKFSIDGIQYICDHNNSVEFEDSRCLYTFGSFINHRCEQNCYTVEIDGVQFQKACRDINPGQEINTNYYHYDYDGCLSFKCLCNSPICYGQIKGFKSLSLQNKIKVLPRALSWMKEYWMRDDKTIAIVEDLKVPDTFNTKIEQNTLKFYSKKNFNKGDEMFRFKKDENLKQGMTVIYKIDQEYKKWNENNQFLYFASLLTTKPDPNCQILAQGTELIGICLKSIIEGDQIFI